MEFQRIGMEFVRYPAIDTPQGKVGCRESHLELLRGSRGYEDIPPKDVFAIFEDDVQFLFTAGAIDLAMDELPPDWDMLYLGCSPQEPFVRYSPHLLKMGASKTTHAIVWHYREKGAIDFILKHKYKIDKWDVFLSEWIHPKFNCFCSFPLIATQHQTQSDIAKRSDLSTIVKNYNKYCI